MIKINFEWINKFNQNNITSIEFNDNIYELNLNLLKNFINLNELHLPLTINNIIGSYVLNIPNLKILECDPKLLKYFNGINLDMYLIHKDINEIKMLENYTYLTNINAKILILFKNLKRIKEGIFDNSFFKLIICNIHHVPFLNKSIVKSIMLKEDDIDHTIYTNTFYNFINLELVILPKNIKKIESKAFNNCKNLRYVQLPENCSDIRWDSFFKCNKCKIDCNDEIKQKLEQFAKINNKPYLTKYDLKNYTLIEGLEIDFNTKVFSNSLKDLTNLKMIKCNPEILNELPLNSHYENNLTVLVIQSGTKYLTKKMFKYSINLEFISIPLSVEEIENGTFDECTKLRVVECDPKFLNYFTNQFITTFIIQEGVKFIYKNHFEGINYIQNFIIPKSVKFIEEGAFYNLKKVIFLKCEEQWNSDKYFPFKYEIEEGRTIIDPEIFNGWYNLKTLIIPNSVKTIFPFTFAHCRSIKYLKCSPDYFKFLYVKNVKVLILPEGVESLNNGDLKDFINLIYLRLPNSIKNIEEDVFNETPCLNYENISDHPIIRRIRKKKFEDKYDNKKKKFDFIDFLLNMPSIDKPNYDFEDNNKESEENKLKEKENKNENDHEISESKFKDKKESNSDISERKYKDKNEKEDEKKIENERFFPQTEKKINNKFNLYDNVKNNNYNNICNEDDKYINNFIINKKKKTERTVEDIVKYDKTNLKYAPFITEIINSINKGRNNIGKGNSLQNLSHKLAKICIKIKKKYNFVPRPVQILAILRLADSVFNNNGHGSIGEIKTGEGKSFIVSTLAILLCQFDKKVDIITSNIELASRDQKEQEKNFELFGITSGVLFKEDEKEYLKGNKSYDLAIEQGYDLGVFKNQIVYSTNSNFEFVYLNSMFVAKPLRPYKRKYDIVIVDEVDNMFIDQGTSPALLSEKCDIIHYEDILNVIYYNRDKRVDILHKIMNALFRNYAFFNSEEGFKKIIDLKEAALASDRKIKDIDYIVDNGKVIIIDSHTGLKKPNSKWKDSIHEMVEIKEGIKPDHHSVTYTAVTQHDFFNLYNKILGVTGTVGTDKDRRDLKSIYGVEIFKCPRHFLKEKIIYRTKRPEGLDNIFISLNKEIKKEIEKDRPVLVIMDNIRNVDEYVLQSPLKNISTIKGINPDEDEKSRNIAGQEGKVTIATSAAGRGVDIKLSKISLKNGGLHVIIPFLMPNQRALEQAAGRCGRQGQSGSVNIYYSEDDYYLMSKAFDIKEHNLWIIQNKLVDYFHNNMSFLFEGKGNDGIDLELPSCIPIPKVIEMYEFEISKEKNHEQILDYSLDMIKITWGLFFNDLTNDDKCESLDYCESKLKQYLNYVDNIKNYEKKDEKKDINIQQLSDLFGNLKISADILLTFICPQLKPFIIGGIDGIKEIVNAMINNEEINWKNVFIKFGEGALEGLQIKGKVGKVKDIIITPLFEFISAKMNGKDYNLFQGINRKIFEQLSGKITKVLNKNIRKPIEDEIKRCSLNNEGLQKMAEKFQNIGNKKIIKDINYIAKTYSKNLYQNFQEKSDYYNLYALARMIDESTTDTLLGNSIIEDDIFGNIFLKTNKKTVKDFIQKKYEERKKTSSKDDIKNGLRSLLYHKDK